MRLLCRRLHPGSMTRMDDLLHFYRQLANFIWSHCTQATTAHGWDLLTLSVLKLHVQVSSDQGSKQAIIDSSEGVSPCSDVCCYCSVTRLGSIRKALAIIFHKLVAKISCTFLGSFEKHHFQVKTAWPLIGTPSSVTRFGE